MSYNASDVNTELGAINTALGDKANLANPTFTGTVAGITKSMVGSGKVENTSDESKIISTLIPLYSPINTNSRLEPNRSGCLSLPYKTLKSFILPMPQRRLQSRPIRS